MKKTNPIRLLCIGLFILFISFSTFAQNTTSNTNEVSKVTYERKEIAEEGTFVFVKKDKRQEIFTTERYDEIRRIIAQSRDAAVQVTISISDLTEVTIPPFSVINSPSYVPYPTLFSN